MEQNTKLLGGYLAAAVLPKKHPALYEWARIKYTPRILKVVCYSIVAINGLIFLFLAIAMTQSALIYLGMA
jgi:hypothetical protein